MDTSYFYIIPRFRRLSEASSSRSIHRISGANEIYSIYPNGKGYVHIFHIWIVCYTPAWRCTPALCVDLPLGGSKAVKKNVFDCKLLFKLPNWNLKSCFNPYQSVLLDSRDSSRLPPIRCYHVQLNSWTLTDSSRRQSHSKTLLVESSNRSARIMSMFQETHNS